MFWDRVNCNLPILTLNIKKSVASRGNDLGRESDILEGLVRLKFIWNRSNQARKYNGFLGGIRQDSEYPGYQGNEGLQEGIY